VLNSRIAIGPMSPLVIQAINDFTKNKNIKIMIIASRNQIDFESGYVNNWITETFSKYVRNFNNENLILCRDHCGPYFSPNDNELKIIKAVELTKKTIEADIINDFKIIHIDTSFCGKAKYEIMKELISYAINYSKKKNKIIEFEVGSDENNGTPVDPVKFDKYLKKITSFCNPKFIVAQTGSLTKEIFQVGQFDFKNVKKICNISKNYNINFKEHNCDYLDKYQIKLRRLCGVDAINVAPEFGVIQTKLTYYKGIEYGLNNYVEKFRNKVITSNKWKKWKYGKISNELKFLSSGHYCFSSLEYKSLFEKISKYFDIQSYIKKELIYRINTYKKNLL
jgi:hypothetical protein